MEATSKDISSLPSSSYLPNLMLLENRLELSSSQKCSAKREVSLPKILSRRQLYGKAKELNRLISRRKLHQMDCSLYPLSVGRRTRYIAQITDFIFIGLSNDNRYVVALMWTECPDLLPFPTRFEIRDDETMELILVVFELSPTVLKPAFITSFSYWPTYAAVYATFPYDSSHISVVSFPKLNEPEDASVHNVEPFSVIAAVRFILFRFNIHISFTTCLVISYRWKGLKMSRTILRSTDHGGILNGGTVLASYLFTKECPPLKCSPVFRTILQVLDRSVACDALKSFEGYYSQDIEVNDASPFFRDNISRQYGFKHITDEDEISLSTGLQEPLFFTESVLDIERLLHGVMPKVVQFMCRSYKCEGLIDYEVDMFDCIGYTANVLITAVIEAKGPGEAGKNSAYIALLHIVWDTFEGTCKIHPWRGIRMVDWSIAHRPDQWYPFRFTKKADALDERMLSNLPYLNGLSSIVLASPSPGITIWKEMSPE